MKALDFALFCKYIVKKQERDMLNMGTIPIKWTFKEWKKGSQHRIYIDGDNGKHGSGYIDVAKGNKIVVTKSFYGGKNSVESAAEQYLSMKGGTGKKGD